MTVKGKTVHIIEELKHHAPFTFTGALLGIVFMLIFRQFSRNTGHGLFLIFHPLHVLLSAMVTASLYKLHKKQAGFLKVLIIGYLGSIGVATLSDSVMPYIGEHLLGLDIPAHEHIQEGQDHDHTTSGAAGQEPIEEHAASESAHASGDGLHLGFIVDWYIVNPAALVGIILAYFIKRSKCPHAAHVLVSTWASSAHILMNTAGPFTLAAGAGIFLVLFLSVWLPCCISDIVFPMLFVGPGEELACACCHHAKEDHDH
ncbi:MAG: hypothetical protein JW860_00130 [Sedimentisphaerales bacterium]|nr:hypothetical protein [Sedimentisphaerales bacterium]